MEHPPCLCATIDMWHVVIGSYCLLCGYALYHQLPVCAHPSSLQPKDCIETLLQFMSNMQVLIQGVAAVVFESSKQSKTHKTLHSHHIALLSSMQTA